MRKAPKLAEIGASGHPRNGYPYLSQGAEAFSPEVWRQLTRTLKFSPRELQIVRGIFDNKLEFTIAKDLGISVNTIHTQTRRLRTKLKAADRVAIVLCVLEEFLRLTTSDEAALPSICRNHTAGCCPLSSPVK